MYYNKLVDMLTEYQGESFTRGLSKDNGTEWETEDTGYWELLDDDGVAVSSGALQKSSDNLSVEISVPKADTESLSGTYVLLVHITRTDDATFNDVIAKYTITYIEEKA